MNPPFIKIMQGDVLEQLGATSEPIAYKSRDEGAGHHNIILYLR